MTSAIIETRQWTGHAIEKRVADGYVNATSICKATNCLFGHYNANAKTARYLESLKTVTGLEISVLVMTKYGCSTWVHPRVGLDLARWCCPDFAVWMDGWMFETLVGRPSNVSDSLPQATDVSINNIRLYEDQIVIRTETQLHEKIVGFVRSRYPAVLTSAGLGETGSTEALRLANWRKGYTGGCPDLFLYQRHPKHVGFALEFKHPGGLGHISEKQEVFAENLRCQGWLVLITQSYEEAILAIAEYMKAAQVACPTCKRCYSSTGSLANHVKHSHAVNKKQKIETQTPDSDPM
jgi:hypothetical protein